MGQRISHDDSSAWESPWPKEKMVLMSEPAVSLSTAEAELNELIEALMTGANVTAILEELEESGERGICA